MLAISKGRANPTDVHVGHRIRERRHMLGMSQTALAATLGITFQQIQKYEKGTNRVSASRLQAMTTVLGVPVSYFFEGMSSDGHASGRDAGTQPRPDAALSRDALELHRSFARISSPKLRHRVLDLVRALAKGG